MSSYWTKRRNVIKITNKITAKKEQETKTSLADPEPFFGTANKAEKNFSTSVDKSTDKNVNEGDHVMQSHVPVHEVNTNDYYYYPIDRENEDDSDDDSNVEALPNLPLLLKIWAIECKITHTALRELLQILKLFHPSLPIDPRTLLSVCTVSGIMSICNGKYYHFGITNCLKQQFTLHNRLQQLDEIQLQLNIDGLPLFKSSLFQLWPILGMIVNADYCKTPFPIGVYAGEHKPSSAIDFFKLFVEDIAAIIDTGFVYNSKNYCVSIKNVVCDAQARFFIKQVKSCSGYYGCDKCTQSGVYDGTKVVFPKTDAPLRTDDAFCRLVDDEHHRGPNPFVDLSLKMITQFPLDYMHLVCLGVTKRLLSLYLSQRIPARMWICVSERLVGLRKSIPREFARKPRPISEYLRWKATEFRQFLLYTGPVVLHDNIPEPLYKNFLLLSVGVRILCDPNLCLNKRHLAHVLLKSFVHHCYDLFGLSCMVYNIHGLVHLAEDVKNFGPLDNFSSFPYENYLGKLKNLVRKPTHVLEQIVSRLEEEFSVQCEKINVADKIPSANCSYVLKQTHTFGPLLNNFSCKQYNEIQLKNYCLRTKMPDNCVKIGKEIAVVVNILQGDSSVDVIFQKFRCIESLFSYPNNSLDVSICIVSSLDIKMHQCSVLDIDQKLVLLPCSNNRYVVLPLLHSS